MNEQEPKLTLFPCMTGKEFIEFLQRAKEEYDKNNTISDEFISFEKGSDPLPIKDAVKKIVDMVQGEQG